jgi:membrane protease YdiL (CAAX protease family)
MNDPLEPAELPPASSTSSERIPVPRLAGTPMGAWVTCGLALVLMVVHVATAFFAVILLWGISGFEGTPSTGMVIGTSVILTALVAPPLCALFSRWIHGPSVRDNLALSGASIGAFALWTAICMLLAFGLDLYASTAEQENVPELMLEIYRSTPIKPVFWIAVVIAAPIWEEFLFRGFLFEGLRQSLGIFHTIAITSILFGAIHLLQYDSFGVLTTMVIGLSMGLARWLTGSLYVPIVMHTVNNAIAMIQMARAAE